jgi:hypothetical protein
MIGLIVAMLTGVFVTVLALLVGVSSDALAVLIGIGGAVLTFVSLFVLTAGRISRVQAALEVRFPADEPGPSHPSTD